MNCKHFLCISNLPFEDETSFISPNTAIELNKLYGYLYDNPDISIQIRQHTDSRGNAFQNTMLARRRAENIKEYLMKLLSSDEHGFIQKQSLYL